MAKIIWNKQAQQAWREKMLYGFSEFGQTTAVSFVHKTRQIADKLSKHPNCGFIEPLLSMKKKNYRACYIVGPIKIIYYYVESSDTVRIADVWDSRREPKKLAKRIR